MFDSNLTSNTTTVADKASMLRFDSHTYDQQGPPRKDPDDYADLQMLSAIIDSKLIPHSLQSIILTKFVLYIVILIITCSIVYVISLSLLIKRKDF